jgi:hypothetical protein
MVHLTTIPVGSFMRITVTSFCYLLLKIGVVRNRYEIVTNILSLTALHDYRQS